MAAGYLAIEHASKLSGVVPVSGAKNATLVSMAALLLTSGISRLRNVPASADVHCMIRVLEELGALVAVDWDMNELCIDTRGVTSWAVSAESMRMMRASVLVMGPLLARFGRADVALPGGCVIGARPINYHLENFERMGVQVSVAGSGVCARTPQLKPQRLVLEYPSVGATENILMAATLTPGRTDIINAALEPEVLDLIVLLRAMGANIEVTAPATISIEGCTELQPVTDHAIMPDRLEAGTLLLAAAMTGGQVTLPNAYADHLDMFLYKLKEMGHQIKTVYGQPGITLTATDTPRAVSFKTHPYPGFPTDLQAPMSAAQCVAEGTSVIEETVFENRLVHCEQLRRMGADIVINGRRATITGVQSLQGAAVAASDIRASCALALAGCVAQGTTIMSGVHHWQRGYDALEQKLCGMGARITVHADAGAEVASEVMHQL